MKPGQSVPLKDVLDPKPPVTIEMVPTPAQPPDWEEVFNPIDILGRWGPRPRDSAGSATWAGFAGFAVTFLIMIVAYLFGHF
jgi:hypothetical protein